MLQQTSSFVNWIIVQQLAAVSCENGWCLVHCSFLVSLHFKAKFSNPSTLCSKSRLSSSRSFVPVSKTQPIFFVSFLSGRTDPVPIILKYDVMGMGRMEMEVGCPIYPLVFLCSCCAYWDTLSCFIWCKHSSNQSNNTYINIF